MFHGLGQVGLDGHLRNRFWNQEEESFTSRFTVKRDGSESSSGSEVNLQTNKPLLLLGDFKMWAEPGAARRRLVNRAPKTNSHQC